MAVVFQSGYTLPSGDYPLTHARIAHSGNWLSGGTYTADTTDADYFEAGPNNVLTYEKWKPTALPATWEYDHGSSVECDYACIGASNLATAGCNYKVQYWDGAAWVDLTATTTPTDDSAAFVIFEPVTAQRWRIRITSGAENPVIGVIKFGKAMQMPRPIAGGHTPMEYARQTVIRANTSGTGEFLGLTKQRTSLTGSFSWGFLTPAWVEANWKDFQTSVEAVPFFIAWRPSKYDHCAICYVSETPQVSFTGSRDWMQASFNVTGYAHD